MKEQISFNVYEFTVLDHIPVYFINADDSGLFAFEKERCDEVACEFDGIDGHWDLDVDEEASFQRCEITGKRGNCVTLRFNQIVRTLSEVSA